jgi:hypothetical protein
MHYRVTPLHSCVEAVFLISIGQPTKDMLSAILFTILFGFALPVWSNLKLDLKRVQCQLDDLQGSIKVTVITRMFEPVIDDLL